jgi:hypothetical protein
MKTLADPINKLLRCLRRLVRICRLSYWHRYLAKHATDLRPEELADIAGKF